MERYAKGIDLEFMELDAEPRLTHWDAYMLGLAQDIEEAGGETDSSALAEWA
jgi:aryl carrier-like protein